MMVHRAALNIPGSNFDTYFFKDEKYVLVNWAPGGHGTIVHGPAMFAKDSTALRETGFTSIDAILPIPDHSRKAYFFSGPEYALVDFFPNNSIEDRLLSLGTISADWSSLREAGFDHVDGALPVPNSTKQAFVFSGNKYCRIKYPKDVENSDELLEGPTNIVTGWNAMGFTSVDTIFPQPGTSGDRAYVFSGDKCVRTQVTSYGQGAQSSGPYDLAAAWRDSLAKIGFY
ncbi:hypothetical protein BDV93DRAFT_611192 [Ceratobasidium sp. AG-I]|nr:hypothetical protein BDV93DRAFT_611192 [Ceratobasidium sp. AG-I]